MNTPAPLLLQKESFIGKWALPGGFINPDEDADSLEWFPLSEIPPLAFNHTDILQSAEERLKGKKSDSIPSLKITPLEGISDSNIREF